MEQEIAIVSDSMFDRELVDHANILSATVLEESRTPNCDLEWKLKSKELEGRPCDHSWHAGVFPGEQDHGCSVKAQQGPLQAVSHETLSC